MTYEKIKQIRANPYGTHITSDEILEMNRMIDEAVEKMIPKPLAGKYKMDCSRCGAINYNAAFNYCQECGQKYIAPDKGEDTDEDDYTEEDL